MARTPVFLEKRSYRMRRMMDAARLLPFFAGFLFILPILWPHPTETASGVIYVFCAWAGLIVVCAILSRRLPQAEAEGGETAGTTAR